VLRRVSGIPSSDVIRTRYFTLDRTRYCAVLPDRDVTLTPTEFDILATLISQPGRIFSRSQLLTAARGIAFDSYERAIDSHIRNLRRKVEPPENEPQHIITVHGVGYKFVE
jgi:DNA-binding response OmpR family regulator